MQLIKRRTQRSRPRTEHIGTGRRASHLGAAGRIEAGARMIYGEVGRLADESLRLGLRQAEVAVLLVTAAQYAWWDLYLDLSQAAGTGLSAEWDQRARTRRLIRRGVSPEAAAQELHIV